VRLEGDKDRSTCDSTDVDVWTVGQAINSGVSEEQCTWTRICSSGRSCKN